MLVAGPDGAPGLAQAGALARLGRGAFRVREGCRSGAWHHLLLLHHALIRANGAWTESLWPGPRSLSAFGPAVRSEIAAALPSLAPALSAPWLLPGLFGPQLGPVLPLSVLRKLGRLHPENLCLPVTHLSQRAGRKGPERVA
jgi:hypothetical protein